MSCPLFIEFPSDVTPSRVLDVLRSAGISVRSLDDHGRSEWICRRGPVSFHLGIYENEGRRRASFAAHLSGWRWWNFPVMWLLAVPYTGREIRLQRDAFFALREIGAVRRGGGGDVLMLDEEPLP